MLKTGFIRKYQFNKRKLIVYCITMSKSRRIGGAMKDGVPDNLRKR